MNRDLDSYYLSKDEPNRSCLLALRSIILGQDPLVSETRKYGMPCFSYRKKMFCYLWTDKKTDEPYILFVEGKHMEFRELETGDRSRMKLLRINPDDDIPIVPIKTILQRALNLYRTGKISS